jgi:hypothetical protein
MGLVRKVLVGAKHRVTDAYLTRLGVSSATVLLHGGEVATRGRAIGGVGTRGA